MAAIPISTSCSRSRPTSSTTRSATAILDKMQQLVHEKAIYAPIWQLGFHQRRSARGSASRLRPDPGLCLYGAVRGHHDQSRSIAPRSRRGIRGHHEAVHLPASSVFAAVAVPAVGDDLLFRPGDRRPGGAAGRAGRQPGGYRRDPQAVRPRSAARGAILAVHDQPVARRSRPVVLLPDAGHEPLSRPAAELAAAGLCRDGPVAADRHSGRDHGLGAGRPVLGRLRQAVHAARPVAAVLPGRAWC